MNFSYYLFTALKHLEMYTKDLIWTNWRKWNLRAHLSF